MAWFHLHDVAIMLTICTCNKIPCLHSMVTALPNFDHIIRIPYLEAPQFFLRSKKIVVTSAFIPPADTLLGPNLCNIDFFNYNFYELCSIK